MNTKNNRRYRKTEEKIEHALNILLKKKRLNEITVREICEEAQIHHTTFYDHYMDIFDLVEKTEQRMEDGLYDRVKQENGIDQSVVSLPFVAAIMSYVKENKDFYKAYLNDYGAAYVNSGFNRVWLDLEKGLAENDTMKYDELKYGFEFSKAGALKVIACWLDGDCRESVDEISGILLNLLDHRKIEKNMQ